MRPFHKAHGCGNDFLILDVPADASDLASLSRNLCDRTRGVGADGVEWICAGSGSADGSADVVARLFNADGSEAEISGNGTRCVAAYWIHQHGGKSVRVRTGAGVKECRLISAAGANFEFEMAMGVAQVGKERKIGARAGLEVSIGNPHFVVFVETFDFPWQKEGAEIQKQPVFPKGVNVEYVRVQGPAAIECRFFERGAGETLSSGTGSCAAAIAAMHRKKTASPVRVASPGGVQTVRLSADGVVFLQGPAQLVCAGEVFI